MASRAPVEKLPLSVRKNFRDEFHAKTPMLQERMSKIGIPNFDFTANPNHVYAYAEGGLAENSLGTYVFAYFETFVCKVEQFTNKGRHAESVQSLKKIVPKNLAVLVPDEEEQFYYCGCDILDGVIRLLFNPHRLSESSSHAGDDLVKVIDTVLNAHGDHELPLSIRRAIALDLNPRLASAKNRIRRLHLGRELVFEPDVAKNYAFLVAHQNEEGHNQVHIDNTPALIAGYFESLAQSLENNRFGKDEGRRDVFNQAMTNGIVRFEVVEKLEDYKQIDCVLDNGDLKLQTTPDQFSLGHLSIGHMVAVLFDPNRP